MHDDVEVEPAAEYVLAEVALRLRLRDGDVEHPGTEEEFTPNVDERLVATDRVARDDDPLEELVGIELDDLAILERAGLALVGIDAEIDRLLGLLREKAPLEAGRKAGAATTAKPRALHHLHELAGLEVA